MTKIIPLEEVEQIERSVAVGNFDGVHLGHQEVIERSKRWARENSACSSVVTFEPHPLTVVNPDLAPKLITPLALKQEFISELAVDELIVIPFDRKVAALNAETFCRKVVGERLTARRVCVGKNFHFGKGAHGNYKLLTEVGGECGYSVDTAELLNFERYTISSTAIRQLVSSGEVTLAAKLLSRPFQIEGQVVAGDARGHELGIPTANIKPDPGLLIPATGIYAARANDLACVVSVGSRPTFHEKGPLLIEVHLLDWQGDLYGKSLRTSFIEYLRPERTFSQQDELVEQMRADIADARAVLGC